MCTNPRSSKIRLRWPGGLDFGVSVVDSFVGTVGELTLRSSAMIGGDCSTSVIVATLRIKFVLESMLEHTTTGNAEVTQTDSAQ